MIRLKIEKNTRENLWKSEMFWGTLYGGSKAMIPYLANTQMSCCLQVSALPEQGQPDLPILQHTEE